MVQLPGAITEACGMEPETIAVDHGCGAGPVTTGAAVVGQVITVRHGFGSLTPLRSRVRKASQQLT